MKQAGVMVMLPIKYEFSRPKAQQHLLFITMPKKHVPKENESLTKTDKNRPKSKHEKREEQKAHKQKVQTLIGCVYLCVNILMVIQALLLGNAEEREKS
jgi:hypothetical protein